VGVFWQETKAEISHKRTLGFDRTRHPSIQAAAAPDRYSTEKIPGASVTAICQILAGIIKSGNKWMRFSPRDKHVRSNLVEYGIFFSIMQ
jgi:hypothetical protein